MKKENVNEGNTCIKKEQDETKEFYIKEEVDTSNTPTKDDDDADSVVHSEIASGLEPGERK